MADPFTRLADALFKPPQTPPPERPSHLSLYVVGAVVGVLAVVALPILLVRLAGADPASPAVGFQLRAGLLAGLAALVVGLAGALVSARLRRRRDRG